MTGWESQSTFLEEEPSSHKAQDTDTETGKALGPFRQFPAPGEGLEGGGKERKECTRFLPRSGACQPSCLQNVDHAQLVRPHQPSHLRREIRHIQRPCSLVPGSGRPGEGAHPPAPSPTQAFPDLSTSPALGPPGLRHWRTRSPLASVWVDDTFLRRGIFLRVGRKRGPTAFNPADRGVGGERGACLGGGRNQCSGPHWDPLPRSAQTCPLLLPLHRLPDFSNCTTVKISSPRRVTWREETEVTCVLADPAG